MPSRLLMLGACALIFAAIPLALGVRGAALPLILVYVPAAAIMVTGGRWAEMGRALDPAEFAAEAWVNCVGLALVAVPLFAVGAGARFV
jgi:NADH:ubiquinone oxidoreductase subunit 6 (subunit J)